MKKPASRSKTWRGWIVIGCEGDKLGSRPMPRLYDAKDWVERMLIRYADAMDPHVVSSDGDVRVFLRLRTAKSKARWGWREGQNLWDTVISRGSAEIVKKPRS